MRPLTQKEKDFNALAKDYKIRAATATKFDKAQEKSPLLHEAYDSFNAPPEEDNSLRHLGIKAVKPPKFYEILEDKSGMTRQEADESNLTAMLFQLHTNIPNISCREYAETEMYGFYIDNNNNDNDTIYKKIQAWHKIRKIASKINMFIKRDFPRYSKAGIVEKKQYREQIKARIESHEKLGCDMFALKVVVDFLDSEISANSIKSKYLANILLELNLPLINTKETAKKIINNSKM